MDGDAGKYIPPVTSLLQSGYSNPVLRQWQSANVAINPTNLMYPVFISDDCLAGSKEIPSMPGVSCHTINTVVEFLAPAIKNGLCSVMLFGSIDVLEKDVNGVNADSGLNPVVQTVRKLKAAYPELIICCDVCLCGYTSHGHCGIINEDGSLDNTATVNRLAQVALAYAMAGCHVVAPSDMSDGRVGAIKCILNDNGLGSKVSVLSYAAKFASCFYGPFRDAAKSAPSFGNRKNYQLPIGSTGLAMRAVRRDASEGADMFMVKPAMPYLDIIKETKLAFPLHPLFAYQVSGEYAMLYHGANTSGIFDYKAAVMESLTAIRRAAMDNCNALI